MLNTDAEGRLILADALAYLAEQDPSCIVDTATLTGACMVALGTDITGAFGNDDVLAQDLVAAGAAVGEPIWQMPLWQDYRALIDSKVADIKNIGKRYGGAITAAWFLAEFVGDTPWVHLDIAGPAFADAAHRSRSGRRHRRARAGAGAVRPRSRGVHGDRRTGGPHGSGPRGLRPPRRRGDLRGRRAGGLGGRRAARCICWS